MLACSLGERFGSSADSVRRWPLAAEHVKLLPGSLGCGDPNNGFARGGSSAESVRRWLRRPNPDPAEEPASGQGEPVGEEAGALKELVDEDAGEPASKGFSLRKPHLDGAGWAAVDAEEPPKLPNDKVLSPSWGPEGDASATCRLRNSGFERMPD